MVCSKETLGASVRKTIFLVFHIFTNSRMGRDMYVLRKKIIWFCSAGPQTASEVGKIDFIINTWIYTKSVMKYLYCNDTFQNSFWFVSIL